MLNVVIDKGLPTPAYLQLRNAIAARISSGSIPPGHALPSERQLAQELGLSRMTVRHALASLVKAGLLEQRQGSGTFVKGRELEQNVDRLEGFTEEMQHLGLTPGARILSLSVAPAPSAAAAALNVSSGAPLTVLKRLRLASGQPVAVQTAWLTPDLSGLTAEDIGATGSLYRAIRQRFGRQPARARQKVSARLPDPAEQELLGIAAGAPVLGLERTTFDSSDVPFEFVQSAYHGDLYRLMLDLRSP